jgi:D-glycero-alpha-D-manno-heptose-7-phosphate kinase
MVASRSDAPSNAGLASSSAFTVGLLHALNAMSDTMTNPEQLAREAYEVEIDGCREPIGVQDQFAVAFGGLNLIEFLPDDSVIVSPLCTTGSTAAALNSHLLVLFTGIRRRASTILAAQRASTLSDPRKHKLLLRMVRLAYELKDELRAGRVTNVGEILHENWMLKRSLSASVSSNCIDEWYEIARHCGAVGGKLLGAGGGGCMLFFAPPERHADIVNALPQLSSVPFRFQSTGTRILATHPVSPSVGGQLSRKNTSVLRNTNLLLTQDSLKQ